MLGPYTKELDVLSAAQKVGLQWNFEYRGLIEKVMRGSGLDVCFAEIRS